MIIKQYPHFSVF
ncbi:rCG59253, partial [Rattus norvegicus]